MACAADEPFNGGNEKGHAMVKAGACVGASSDRKSGRSCPVGHEPLTPAPSGRSGTPVRWAGTCVTGPVTSRTWLWPGDRAGHRLNCGFMARIRTRADDVASVLLRRRRWSTPGRAWRDAAGSARIDEGPLTEPPTAPGRPWCGSRILAGYGPGRALGGGASPDGQADGRVSSFMTPFLIKITSAFF